MQAEVVYMHQSLDPFNNEDDVKTSSISTRFCLGAKITINSYISQVFSAWTFSSPEAPQGGETIAARLRHEARGAQCLYFAAMCLEFRALCGGIEAAQCLYFAAMCL